MNLITCSNSNRNLISSSKVPSPFSPVDAVPIHFPPTLTNLPLSDPTSLNVIVIGNPELLSSYLRLKVRDNLPVSYLALNLPPVTFLPLMILPFLRSGDLRHKTVFLMLLYLLITSFLLMIHRLRDGAVCNAMKPVVGNCGYTTMLCLMPHSALSCNKVICICIS